MREDLSLREYAESLGWTRIYSRRDYTLGRTGFTLKDFPHDSVTFEKGTKALMFGGQSYPTLEFWWAVIHYPIVPLKGRARLKYDTLKQALDQES